MLERRRFQFNSFCPVLHAQATSGSKVQVNEDLHLLHITQGRSVLHLEGASHTLEPGVVIHHQLWRADGPTRTAALASFDCRHGRTVI